MSQTERSDRVDPSRDAPAHYWSYRALLEDKRRCLNNMPHVRHDLCNSLQKEGEDFKISQKAMSELKRHMRVTLDRDWDPKGVKTPPHAFLSDENQPHFSQKELAEKKKKMQTQIRRPASARPAATPSAPREGPPVDREWQGGSKRSAKDIAKATGGENQTRKNWEAPTMGQLMQPGGLMDRKHSTEKEALQERRSSSVPHDSHEVLTWKKKFHATRIHEKKPSRSQSARCLGSAASESSIISESTRRDPTMKSYQGSYPKGNSSEAWPDGRDDPKKIGRYRSQAYLSIDKRRHAATINGGGENPRARSRDQNENLIYDEQGGSKPSQTADQERIQYRSQHALAQHKRRHLANLNQDADGYSTASPRTPYSTGETTQQELFSSHKNLEYGKRGHVVTLSARETSTKRRGGASSTGGDSESSCDVGKGISRMMHKHREGMVHTSQAEFHLKKKNHATSVHVLPRPESEKDNQDLESINGANALVEQRRPSNPHNSCKAFALKKKYHQTGVNVKLQSRLHPETLKAEPLDRNPEVLNSQKSLNTLKKMHMFEYNPESRVKPATKPIPAAPVPRNGQWTPQHVCD
jgi:hypothetical protein